MPSAESSNQHPRTMTISPWSIPFYSPQKKVVGSFLREVNVGIISTPTPLAILKWNTTIDDGLHSWACPAVSPCSAGFACPVSLYGCTWHRNNMVLGYVPNLGYGKGTANVSHTSEMKLQDKHNCLSLITNQIKQIHEDCRGQTGSLVTFGQDAVASSSNKMKCNTKSSTETVLYYSKIDKSNYKSITKVKYKWHKGSN